VSVKQDRGGITNAELAVILHFGAPNAGIPARPFLSMAFDQHREPLAKMGAELMGKVILGEVSLDKALGLMGAKLAAESKKTITVGSQLTPNAPATVAKKGSDRPLVDTGRLLNSITWAIEKEH
jgi:phage gpG-like protein